MNTRLCIFERYALKVQIHASLTTKVMYKMFGNLRARCCGIWPAWWSQEHLLTTHIAINSIKLTTTWLWEWGHKPFLWLRASFLTNSRASLKVPVRVIDTNFLQLWAPTSANSLKTNCECRIKTNNVSVETVGNFSN